MIMIRYIYSGIRWLLYLNRELDELSGRLLLEYAVSGIDGIVCP